MHEKYGIVIKLLSITYFHLKLLLTLPEVMILKLNLEPSRNVNVEMISQSGIQIELNSWVKYEIIGPVVQTPKDVILVKYKWVFVRKCNEIYEIMRYKVRLVAQSFLQKPDIDYEETYTPVMDAITFRSLISLVIIENLNMCISIWIIG